MGIAEALAAVGASVVTAYHGNCRGRRGTRRADRRAGAGVDSSLRRARPRRRSRRSSTPRWPAFGRVDILINNAGITEPRPLLEMAPEEWDRTQDVNLRGAFFCTQRAAREMVNAGERRAHRQPELGPRLRGRPSARALRGEQGRDQHVHQGVRDRTGAARHPGERDCPRRDRGRALSLRPATTGRRWRAGFRPAGSDSRQTSDRWPSSFAPQAPPTSPARSSGPTAG